MNKENKNVMFLAVGNENWIGGVYYVKNILFSYINSDEVRNGNVKIYILTNEQNEKIFSDFLKNYSIDIIIYPKNFFPRLINKVTRKIIINIFKRVIDINLISLCREYDIDYIYPITGYPYLALKDKCIHWIPDFQHLFLPGMFSNKEIKRRDRVYHYIAKKDCKLVLSSNNAYQHYKIIKSNSSNSVHIVHFLSYILDVMEGISDEDIKNVLRKFSIDKQYVFVANQFWKHKNHSTLFKAMNEIVNIYGKDILLVCTGNISDPRNKDYFNELIKYIKESKLEDNIKILGFISRKEQLSIMAYANLIIQPSLFEGWGTGVEDAKALGKKIIMSDIDVHFEQANENCIIFEKENYKLLAQIIIDNFKNDCFYDYKNIIDYTEKSSCLYSKEMIDVFKDN